MNKKKADKRSEVIKELIIQMRKKDNTACTIELAQEFLKHYPDVSAIWNILGNELVSLSRFEEAKKAINKAIKYRQAEKSDVPYVNMGFLYNEKGDYKRAKTWFKKALEINKKDTNTNVFMGAVLAKQGKYSEAKKYHKYAIKFETELPDEAYYNLGLIERAEGKYKKALEYFNEAIKLDPKYTEAKKAKEDILELIKLKKKGFIKTNI